ncbi:MAG: PilZ domain-containing protein [Planctomycetes bacterium]|nr:PilZ domain-containing protein [Planctomycetota bacterium]
MTDDPKELPKPSDADRRQWPRADADWPIRLLLPEGHFEARVRDVSRAGICFFLDRPIPEMTSLRIDLELPVHEGMRFVRGDAVVVRCDKISDRLEHYEIAAFLNDMAAPDRDALEAFVEMAPEDRARSAGAKP